MIYLYARVSSKEQNVARQIEAAKQYKPVDEVFTDKQSGSTFDRAAYNEMKAKLQVGDEVVVKSLDRLGRDKEALKAEIQWFKQNGVVLRILNMPSTLIEFHDQQWIAEMVNNILIEVLSTFAEQERLEIRERQREGIAAMKINGEWERYGRPRKDVEGFVEFLKKQKDGFITVSEGCEALGISKTQWYRLAKVEN